MWVEAKIGGRPSKDDCRTLQNWVGKLKLVTSREMDPFILAAIYRALCSGTKAKGLRTAIEKEATRCAKDHVRFVEKQKAKKAKRKKVKG